MLKREAVNVLYIFITSFHTRCHYLALLIADIQPDE